MNPFQGLFSPEKRAARLERSLKRALEYDDHEKSATLFARAFKLLLGAKEPHLFSDLVLTYGPQIVDLVWLKASIPAAQFAEAIRFLERCRLDSAALVVCDLCRDNERAIEILAKQGRAQDLAMRLARGGTVDKELLERAVMLWEQHNGDIRKSPRMGDVLNKIAQYAPESLPNWPRVRETVGQFSEAAELYLRARDLLNAAKCYEAAEMYDKACETYERAGDRENASRMAEALSDLERALEWVVNPEREADLLIRTDRLVEARDFAAGLGNPRPVLDRIVVRARERMQVKKDSHDFSAALQLADIAGCEEGERAEILQLGELHLNRALAAAGSELELEALYREKAKLLELAGHFEEAARIAEEDLGDLDLASWLYEKANRFDKAIGTASSWIRAAELQQKGGNPLQAARLFEAAGQYDDAFALYESVQLYDKAIECYLRTADPQQDVLVRLYTEAGEYEKVVETYLDAGSFADLEEALSIATAHNLTSHARVIKERQAEFVRGSEQDLGQCFNEARAQVLDMYSTVLGIDFGTTNSVVAIFHKESKAVEIVPNAKGMGYEPSFFGVDENNHPIFGETARLRSLTDPDCVVARVKRSLGERTRFSIHGQSYKGEQVVAYLLQHLQANAEAYLQAKVKERFRELAEGRGLRFPAQALKSFLDKQNIPSQVQGIVLCVPAYFNDDQKRATRDSAQVAGLHIRRLLHEPTAAALAYGYQRPYSGKLAVIDLGGGTLDISIVDIGEGVHDVLSVGGDTKLGGSDIDAALVQHAIEDIRRTWGIDVDERTHPVEVARLRDACENAKINLSSAHQYTLELRHFMGRPSYELKLTRAELERLSGPILDRIKSTVKKTSREFGSPPDHFVLVGNATKMPAVRDLTKATIRATELRGFDPGAVVAIGAALEGAILAGDLKQTLLLDIVPYSLGIAALKGKDAQVEEISRLIEKNARIPIKRSEVYSTRLDNQPNVHIRIYQGESPHPDQNYCLGNFFLEGIPPQPAGVPKIEVTFDISVDCILTVSAVDQATGNSQSIRIEGAVGLSSREKRDLSEYFEQRQKSHGLEQELKRLRSDIDALQHSCEQAIRETERTIQAFSARFHEKVEVNPGLYTATPDQVGAIQAMFAEKEQFAYGLQKYRDRLDTTRNNLAQTERVHLDFSDPEIASRLRERIDALASYHRALEGIVTSVRENVTATVSDWVLVLDAMEPDLANMAPLEAANHYLTDGKADRARDALESLAAGEEGLTQETFHLLLRCYVALGLQEEYRDAHRRYGRLFGHVYPDLSRLNAYLKVVDESVFMIQGVSEQHGFSGSGFCIAPHLIVTNRHVVEAVEHWQQIKVISKNTTLDVEHVELDPFNDLAVLRVGETLQPLKLGEFDFVEPGESVFALGFPAPSSTVHSENLYVSAGIVNSIRKTDVSPERVIFTDAKIAGGMSGGPLFNDLGEVVGIVTLIIYAPSVAEKGHVFAQDLPVALPIHLVKKYVIGSRGTKWG